MKRITSARHTKSSRQKCDFIAALEEGLKDAVAGRVIDDAALGRELDLRFGPLLPKAR